MQHLIKEDSVKLKELITIEEANVYLCGNLEMGKEVTHILEQILGKDYVEKMVEEKRFVKELWAS